MEGVGTGRPGILEPAPQGVGEPLGVLDRRQVHEAHVAEPVALEKTTQGLRGVEVQVVLQLEVGAL